MMEISGSRALLLEKLERTITFLKKVNKLIVNIGLISLFAMMLVDTLNIVGISFGVRVVPGGKTIIEELMTVVVYIGLAYVFLERGHIKTEILKKHFSPRIKSISNIISYLVIILVSGFICWTNGVVAVEYFRQNTTSPAAIAIPMGPFFLLIALSFFNIGVCSLFFLVAESVKGWTSNPKNS